MPDLRKAIRSILGAMAYFNSLFISAAVAEPIEPGSLFLAGTANHRFLIVSSLEGLLIVTFIFTLLYYERVHRFFKRLQKRFALTTGLSRVEADFRALMSIESQLLLIWTDNEPLVLYRSPQLKREIPSDPNELLHFDSWLHPAGATRLVEALGRLRSEGVGFACLASTLEGHMVEIIGGTHGSNALMRVRLLSSVSDEMLRIAGENERLRREVVGRERLFEAMPGPVWFRDEKGAITWVNGAYAVAVGAKSSAEAIAKQLELFESKERADLMRIGRVGKPSRLKVQTVVNGAVHTYEVFAGPIDCGSGGAAFDISPLAIAKEELERQMVAHARTLDKVSTGVAVFSADRSLVYSNQAFATIWGIESEWLDQRPSASDFLDLLRRRRLLPEQRDYRKWRDDTVLAWGRDRGLDQLWHRPDGRTVHVVTDCRIDGGLTFLFDDVTEKLSLERQYHGLIEGQRETLDNLNEGVAVFGTDGRLQLYNPAFQLMWNLQDDVLQHTPHLKRIAAVCEGLAPDPDFWNGLHDIVLGMPDARDIVTGTLERNDKTHLAYAITPLPDGGTLLSFADITYSKRFEEVLLERNEALEASDRLKTAFLSHVSYELRTPLTTIIGFADFLTEPTVGPLNPKQQEYLNDIKASSQALLYIINDIIDLAVIDAGALDLKLAPVPVATIIEAAELGVRERLARAKVELAVRIATDAGTVMADEGRLIQALYNLLSNAISFAPENSTITLNCRREKSAIAIGVQDNGLGIPEEEQASLFDRFASRGKASRHRGAGLGLSLVKSIVGLHKGRVELRSTPETGTTVTIFLPDHHPALQNARLNADSAKAEMPAA